MRPATLYLLAAACLWLPMLSSCGSHFTASAYTSYLRLPLAALRQLPWQQNSSQAEKDFCTRPGHSDEVFLLVMLPQDAQLNDLEFRLEAGSVSSGPGASRDWELLVAPAGQESEAISRKFSQPGRDPCDWQSDVMEPSSRYWRNVSKRSVDLKLLRYRASLPQPEPVGYIFVKLTFKAALDDFTVGLFAKKVPDGSLDWSVYCTVLATCSLVGTLILLPLVSIVSWRIHQCRVCSKKKCNKDCKMGNHYYSDAKEEREFPPDTGIYMT